MAPRTYSTALSATATSSPSYPSGFERKRAVRKVLELRKNKNNLSRVIGVSASYGDNSEYDIDLTLLVWKKNNKIKDYGINILGHLYVKVENPKNSAPGEKKEKIIYPVCPKLFGSLKETEIDNANLSKLANKGKYIIANGIITELPEHLVTNEPRTPVKEDDQAILIIDDEQDTKAVTKVDAKNGFRWGQKFRGQGRLKGQRGSLNSPTKSVSWADDDGQGSPLATTSKSKRSRYYNNPIPEVEKSYKSSSSAKRDRDGGLLNKASSIINKYFGKNSRSRSSRRDHHRDSMDRADEHDRWDRKDRERDNNGASTSRETNPKKASEQDRYKKARNRRETFSEYTARKDREFGFADKKTGQSSDRPVRSESMKRRAYSFASEDIREKEKRDLERFGRRRNRQW